MVLIIRWNPDFSNPQYFKISAKIQTLNPNFPSLVKHCNFFPRFFKLPDNSNQFAFPRRFDKSGQSTVSINMLEWLLLP